MCGRYKLEAPTGRVFDEFALTGTRLNLQPRYNMAPTQEAPIVRRIPARMPTTMPTGRQITMIRWGLIPGWSPPQRPGMPVGTGQINARAETVAEKPTFRDAMKQRRCLVIADGFYEWRQEAREKRPMLFERADGGLMAFAGLWERWENLESFAIICTAANALVGKIHDRMPVILAKEYWDAWLDTDNIGVADVLPLLTSYPADAMTVRPVSPRLNKVSAEDDPSLLTDEPPVQRSLF